MEGGSYVKMLDTGASKYQVDSSYEIALWQKERHSVICKGQIPYVLKW